MSSTGYKNQSSMHSGWAEDRSPRTSPSQTLVNAGVRLLTTLRQAMQILQARLKLLPERRPTPNPQKPDQPQLGETQQLTKYPVSRPLAKYQLPFVWEDTGIASQCMAKRTHQQHYSPHTIFPRKGHTLDTFHAKANHFLPPPSHIAFPQKQGCLEGPIVTGLAVHCMIQA